MGSGKAPTEAESGFPGLWIELPGERWVVPQAMPVECSSNFLLVSRMHNKHRDLPAISSTYHKAAVTSIYAESPRAKVLHQLESET
jgi:hypothetical protein